MRLQYLYIHQVHFVLVVILKCGKLLFRYEWRVHIPNFYYTLRGFLFQLEIEYFLRMFKRNLTCPASDLGTIKTLFSFIAIEKVTVLKYVCV